MSLVSDTLNRVCKWRTVFSGWQLGTRVDTDPECQAVRDQRELLILMRIEVSALVRLLVDKKLLNPKEYEEQLIIEADCLDRAKMRTKVIGQIHDSIVADVPDEEVQEYVELCKDLMTKRLLEHWKWITIPLEIEVVPMKLRDLGAYFVAYGTTLEQVEVEEGGTRAPSLRTVQHIAHVETLLEAQGVWFMCPKCFAENHGPVGTHWIDVTFASRGVLPGQGTHNKKGDPVRWEVLGSGLDDLTTTPSILLDPPGCCWHGFIKNGDIT